MTILNNDNQGECTRWLFFYMHYKKRKRDALTMDDDGKLIGKQINDHGSSGSEPSF